MGAANLTTGLLLSVLLAPVGAQTGCQTCSAPGGDCSKAYKGGPGVSCGEVDGNSFCCPTSRNELGGANCWKCQAQGYYRCYSSNKPPSNICGDSGNPTHTTNGGSYSELQTSSLVTLLNPYPSPYPSPSPSPNPSPNRNPNPNPNPKPKPKPNPKP